jgi:hypothetical protein
LAPRKNDSGIDSAYSIQKDIDEDDMMNGRLMGTSRPLDRRLKKLKPKDEGVPGEGRKDAPKSQQNKIDGRRIFFGSGNRLFGATGQDIHSNDQYLHQARHNSYLRDQAETAMVLNIFRQF